VVSLGSAALRNMTNQTIRIDGNLVQRYQILAGSLTDQPAKK
jgi:hypothetical protein